jgi:TonB family protein
MTIPTSIRRAALVLVALHVAATAVQAAGTVRPPELKNRQHFVTLLLDTHAGHLVRGGFSGVAEVMVEVDVAGRVGAVKMVRPTGNDMLNRTLLSLAPRLSFVPAMENGEPVRSWVSLPFIFGNGVVH